MFKVTLGAGSEIGGPSGFALDAGEAEDHVHGELSSSVHPVSPAPNTPPGFAPPRHLNSFLSGLNHPQPGARPRAMASNLQGVELLRRAVHGLSGPPPVKSYQGCPPGRLCTVSPACWVIVYPLCSLYFSPGFWGKLEATEPSHP